MTEVACFGCNLIKFNTDTFSIFDDKIIKQQKLEHFSLQGLPWKTIINEPLKTREQLK